MDSPILESILSWEQKQRDSLGTRIRRDGQAERVEAQAMVLYDSKGDILGMEILGQPKVIKNGLET